METQKINEISFKLQSEHFSQLKSIIPDSLMKLFKDNVLGKGKVQIVLIDRKNFILKEESKKEKNLLKGLEGVLLASVYSKILNKIEKESDIDLDLFFNVASSAKTYIVNESEKPYILIDFKGSLVEYDFINVFLQMNGYILNLSDSNSLLKINIDI